jgi:hypothetical protein
MFSENGVFSCFLENLPFFRGYLSFLGLFTVLAGIIPAYVVDWANKKPLQKEVLCFYDYSRRN